MQQIALAPCFRKGPYLANVQARNQPAFVDYPVVESRYFLPERRPVAFRAALEVKFFSKRGLKRSVWSFRNSVHYIHGLSLHRGMPF